MADIKDNKPYIISIGTDNRPGGVEGEFHLQFKPDIMRVTFGEQEKVAKEFGGTMRVTNGQEWADFYHEADAVKFAEKVVGMNQERETAVNKQEKGARITVKGSHGKVLDLTPSADPVKNSIIETLKDHLVFHDAKSVDDILDKTKDSYEMKVWNRLNKDLWEIAYRKNNTDIRLNISPSDDLSKIKINEHERRYYGQSDIDEPVGDFDLKDLSSVNNNEKAITVEQVQKKAVNLFGNNFEFDYWNDTEAGTKIDRIDLGGMPDTISIDKLEIKDGQLSLYSNDIASDIDLQALDDIELSKVDVSLDDIKGYLNNQQHNKEQTLVECYQFAGMGNGTQFWPDRGTLGAYQAYAFKDNNILVFKDADDSKGVLLSSLPHEEQEQLMDAIGTLLDKHIASKAAKRVIHDRIVMPSARSFTANQVEILNRYHQVVTPDTPANEAFSRLLDEVAQEPDVARKPEKWVTDTARELKDLAADITREQDQGLKR